ncbi:hypothetical protein NECAME_05076 [Necator americanus]|uniref:Uncharacterized protein n=1 Tax=Necator americanus TaxID=51031 RepID=W2SJW2_NECAM|nr:hypothetical protein NECAME_05076 [Necator americanus]ETN69890.1 hypothetical protein NECAME_05076 [Necator americanus]
MASDLDVPECEHSLGNRPNRTAQVLFFKSLLELHRRKKEKVPQGSPQIYSNPHFTEERMITYD